MNCGMISSWYNRLLLVLSLLLCSSCGPLNNYRAPETEIPVKEIEEKVPRAAPAITTQQIIKDKQTPEEEAQPPKEKEIEEERAKAAPAITTQQIVKDKQTPEEGDQSTLEDKDVPSSPETSQATNQELLDSALDYCQTSNDFWEQGDLDNALDALDKAYSLILKVNRDNNPELLQQKEDLRFTISKRITEVYASRFTVANGYHKAIPLVMNSHVERALSLFKGREKDFFLTAYRRSGKYRPAIVKALKDAGLPEELSWLPLIESGFKVRAFSRARALGMWQFIASTGYKFGLKRDRWIDERMDPEKSTRAAIAYLTELHHIFGDWTTALAAYNCGEGAVLRQIKTQRVNYLDNFWDLYKKLPRETAFYVPKFLAVLHILNDPQAHGLTLPPFEKEINTEEVLINKQVHLKTISKRIAIDYEVLKNLNPELRHHLTPNSPYSLKVPIGKGEMLLARLSDIPVWRSPVPTYIVHRVRSGDSLSVIANRYKTSISAIMASNGLRKRDYLKVGWKLKIPTKKKITSRKKRPSTYVSKSSGNRLKYVVKRGDSLWKIAHRFNTTTKTIRSLNQLRRSTLQIGQVLMISTDQATPKHIQTKKYKVRKGDSPYLIAKRHQMNLAEFLRLNRLTPRSTIFPGQTLQIAK